MSDEQAKPDLKIVPPTEEELDEEEQEFRALRRDLPGVKGASAAGIVGGQGAGQERVLPHSPRVSPDRPHGRLRDGDGTALLCGDA